MTADNGTDSVNTLYIQQMTNLLNKKVREVVHQLRADHEMDGRVADEILAILKPDPEDVYDFPDFSNANISIRNARDVLVQHPKLPGLDEYIRGYGLPEGKFARFGWAAAYRAAMAKSRERRERERSSSAEYESADPGELDDEDDVEEDLHERLARLYPHRDRQAERGKLPCCTFIDRLTARCRWLWRDPYRGQRRI